MTNCPEDTHEATIWHHRVKEDVATGSPQTECGKALLKSARHWPAANALLGECLCGSTLLFTLRN